MAKNEFFQRGRSPFCPRKRTCAKEEPRYRDAEQQRTGVESAITRLMGTRSGARVVKGRERDHATRLDSSKNGVTRKSMLVESARSGDGVKNERLKTERQKDRARSHDRRPPTPSPSHPPYTFSSIARRILAPYISRREREIWPPRTKRNETKRNETKQFNNFFHDTPLLLPFSQLHDSRSK